jgi:hypothetical protein
MKLLSNKKARSSGFMTRKSIRRTATVPFYPGMPVHALNSLGQESKEVVVQQLKPLSGEYRKARLSANRQPFLGANDWFCVMRCLAQQPF